MSEESGKETGEPTPFTAQDAMAFMQKMWNPFAMPMPGSPAAAASPEPAPAVASAAVPPHAIPGFLPGMLPFPNPAAMFAALDPLEVERKIGELRIIEGWLAMSLNLTQMSIKTLELQQASLEALQAASKPAKSKGEAKAKKS
jgi:hypothetical protein